MSKRLVSRFLGSTVTRGRLTVHFADGSSDAFGTPTEGFPEGGSLQALRGGQPADPFAAPGEADLTTHVDFATLAALAAATGASAHGPVGQGALLTALGLFPRTEALVRAAPDRARGLIDAAHRLAAPERMGRLFKALCLCHPSLAAPPGF